MSTKKDIRAWLEYAAMDYSVAQTLFELHHPRPHEIICYHCQQAAEKAIKALFIYLNIPGGIPRKHDLSFLPNQLQQKTDISPLLRRSADTLNVYGVISRYPNEIHVDDWRTEQALQYAQAFLTWAKDIADAQ